MKITKIAILGGGTAGWLAANHLGSELCADKEVEITLIESPEIPTIGVGEGTVPYIMKGLKRFGISEAELLANCDTTFKQGIKFVNWLDPERHGDNHYYHPFDSPYPGGMDISNYWLTQKDKRPFDDVGIQARICEKNLAPKRISAPEYQGELAYAYHFNALKFATLLAKNARERFGVKYLSATVTGATLDDEGAIASLNTKEVGNLAFDFYVDCSGFHSVLLDKVLKVPFVDKSKELLTDSVIVQQVPLKSGEALSPYTKATAHKAGWIWDIPLTTRRGTGFVYCSQYMSDEEAVTTFAQYLGMDESEISPRKIPMKIGYREKFWAKNCATLGLAQGFVEPLEATSILVTDFSAELLAKNFPRETSDIEALSPYYNDVITYVWERVIDFIKLHYCLSDRDDTGFWAANRDPNTWSETLKSRLAKFAVRPPQQSDFFTRFDLFDDKNFLYVLYGMGFSSRIKALDPREIEQSRQLLESNDTLAARAEEILMEHGKWLAGLKAAMARAS
ncbi:tryptophan halogenase family protein [Shewanella zhangzhouensis]|uniref:tryptophan halogenase family protein n=1 Tax=Shewanella zhangzhouensis TaxID=2864213 RepID=UPI001C661121|nr:tryptophan halogenase family protein [Shewanella zhangzhouensis]QYK06213.1 tryptophan 7-halogenase [Shewanella zhangzhouensis]